MEWLTGAQLRLGGGDALDPNDFGITGFQVLGVERVHSAADVDFDTTRRLGEQIYVEGTARFDVDLILAVDLPAFARAAGLESSSPELDEALATADRATITGAFSAIYSADRIPQSASLTRVYSIDSTSPFGRLSSITRVRELSPTEELRRLAQLHEEERLTPAEDRHVREIVDRTDYQTLAAVGVPLVLYVRRILDDLRSYNWHTQNPAISGLRLAGREACAALPDVLQEELGRNVLQAAEGGAFRAQGFIRGLIAFERPWPRAFVQGLAAEGLVNEQYQFRAKLGCLAEAIGLAVRHPQGSEIVDRISNALAESRPKGGAYGAATEYMEAREILEKVRAHADEEERRQVDELIAALEASRSLAVELGLAEPKA